MNIMDWIKKNIGGKDKTKAEKDEAFFGALFHRPTTRKHYGLRGRGFTKKASGESKKRRKMAAKSRKTNRKR